MIKLGSKHGTSRTRTDHSPTADHIFRHIK